MVNYGDLQFAERIMVARRSEMSAEWKVRFAICIASVAIQAFTKLLFSFSDVLKTTNCTFQEVDNIFYLAVTLQYMMIFSPVCVLLNLCVHWMFLHVIHRLESHFGTDHCRQIDGICQLSPRCLSNFWVS
jgi:hypothetical protein